jgi:hypothetical protein
LGSLALFGNPAPREYRNDALSSWRERHRRSIEYDGASGRVTNVAEANALLRRTYRPGWTLNG